MPFSEKIASQENWIEAQIEETLKETNDDLKDLKDLVLRDSGNLEAKIDKEKHEKINKEHIICILNSVKDKKYNEIYSKNASWITFAVQYALDKLWFVDKLWNIDWLYGQKTRFAVIAFQEKWNKDHATDQIAVDGWAGPDTIKRIITSLWWKINLSNIVENLKIWEELEVSNVSDIPDNFSKFKYKKYIYRRGATTYTFYKKGSIFKTFKNRETGEFETISMTKKQVKEELDIDFSDNKVDNKVDVMTEKKIIDANDIPFFKKELEGIDVDWWNTISRDIIIFEKWEKDIVIYRPPWILSYGWTITWAQEVSRVNTDWKKITITNLSNDFIYRKEEISNPKDSIGSTNSWFEFPEVWFQRRQQEYLKKYSKMSNTVFSKYFSKDVLEMQDWQANIGNCYLVAALRSLMESPNYETLIRTSVKIEKSTQYEWVATITLPLWDKNGEEFKVYPSDLKPQPNTFYNPNKAIPPQTVPLQRVRWDKRKKKYVPRWKNVNGKKEPDIMNKNYESLRPLKWPLWMQILEMAYLKKNITTNDDSAPWWVDRLKMEWWFWDQAVLDLIGNQWEREKVWTYWKNSIIKQGLKSLAYKYFNDFHKFRDYWTLASIWRSWKDDSHKYNISGTKQKIFYGHAYTIIDTDPLAKTVTIINPHKTNKPFTLTYAQTCEAFSLISGVGVDFENAYS